MVDYEKYGLWVRRRGSVTLFWPRSQACWAVEEMLCIMVRRTLDALPGMLGGDFTL